MRQRTKKVTNKKSESLTEIKPIYSHIEIESPLCVQEVMGSIPVGDLDFFILF